MKAEIWIWLFTTPQGEDRIIPWLGSSPMLFWDKAEAAQVEAWASDYAGRWNCAYRLARFIEVAE
jgi:hypothetical protein